MATYVRPDTVAAGEVTSAAKHNQIPSAFDAVWVGTTAGDMDYYSAANVKTRLPIGTTRQNMTVVGGVPVWRGVSRCLLSRSTGQSIGNISYTDIGWETESADTDGYFSAGAATQITIPYTALYAVTVNIGWASNSTGLRQATLLSNGGEICRSSLNAVDGASTNHVMATTLPLNNTDVLKVQLWQNSGVSLNTLTGFSMLWSVVLVGSLT